MRQMGLTILSGGLVAGVILVACGGGGGGGILDAPTATGVFKDANVAGLSYVSGKQSDVTGADGSFTYEVGADVTFFLGGLIIGTAPGQPVVTPIDLVRNGTSDNTEVLNIVRFLLVLDDDDDLSNGIRISSDVQQSAKTAPSIWAPVNFAVTANQLDGELNLVIFDLNRLEGVQLLPSVDAARTHLETTLRCLHSGAFRGTLSGDDTGVFGVMVDADTGEMAGYASRNGSQSLITLSGNQAVSLDQDSYFISDDIAAGATFMGQLTDLDNIAGSWELSSAQQPSGSFLGQRLGGTGDALYRFTASYEGSDFGIYTFDITAAGVVTGTAYSVSQNSLRTVNGNVAAAVSLNASTSDSAGQVMAISGTIDLDAGTLDGGWSGTGGGGSFSGSGCRLN